MSEWIDFAIYASFTVVVWGTLSGSFRRLAIPVIADRNTDWLAAHPDVGRRLANSHWFRRSCLLWEAVSIATLVAFLAWPQLLPVLRDAPRWEALKDLNSALFIGGLLYVAGCYAVFYRWLRGNVPLAQRRQATLTPRSIGDHVPRTFQYAVSALVILHLALWVAVGVTGRYATPGFWSGLAFQSAISGVFLWFAVGAVQRSPGALDRIFGSRYREIEVRAAVAVQLLPLMNGATRLYEQVAAPPPDSVRRFLHLALVLLIEVFALALAVGLRKSSFDLDETGLATAIVLHQNGVAQRARRID